MVVRYGAVADRTYWFVAQYIGLLALSPFLNRLVAGMTKVEYRTLIVILLLLDFSFTGMYIVEDKHCSTSFRYIS